MAKTRQNKPGKVIAISRRTMHGANFFGADLVKASRLLVYLLCIYSRKHKIDVLAVALMGNHVHLVIFDRKNKATDFYQDLFGTMAMAWKRYLTKYTSLRPDSIWDGRQPHVMPVLHIDYVLKAVVYCALNPVFHRIVNESNNYAGFVSTPEMIVPGYQRKPRRPPYYFVNEKKFKEQSTLTFKAPPGISKSQWSEKVKKAYDFELARFQRLLAAQRKSEKKMEEPEPRYRSNSPKQSMWTKPRPASRRVPDFSGPWSLKTQARRDHRSFLEKYCQSRDRLLAGEPTVFPAGTVFYKRRGAPCQPFSEAEVQANRDALYTPIPDNEYYYPPNLIDWGIARLSPEQHDTSDESEVETHWTMDPGNCAVPDV